MSSVLQCQQIVSCSSDSSTKPLTAAFSPSWAFGIWWHQKGKHMLSGTQAPKVLLLTPACLSRHSLYNLRERRLHLLRVLIGSAS